MRSASPRKRGNAGWRKLPIDPAKLVTIFKELEIVTAGKGEMVVALAHFDRQGRPRRLHGRWADGWSATLYIFADGGFSLTQSLKLTVKGSAKP